MRDLKVLEKEYPCLAAVNRCANGRASLPLLSVTVLRLPALPNVGVLFLPAAVPRHQARVIKLQYCGEGPIQKTLMLVGKVRGSVQVLPSLDSFWTGDVMTVFFSRRASPTTPAELTSKPGAAWPACTGTSVAPQLSLASSR